MLVAYSLHNTEVGYCQSLNYVCAVLLLFANEEESFWLLDSIVHRILPPGYYTRTMDDCMADQRCLGDLLKWRMPGVWRALRKMKADWQIVCIQWYLCLFVNCMPLETTLR